MCAAPAVPLSGALHLAPGIRGHAQQQSVAFLQEARTQVIPAPVTAQFIPVPLTTAYPPGPSYQG